MDKRIKDLTDTSRHDLEALSIDKRVMLIVDAILALLEISTVLNQNQIDYVFWAYHNIHDQYIKNIANIIISQYLSDEVKSDYDYLIGKEEITFDTIKFRNIVSNSLKS